MKHFYSAFRAFGGQKPTGWLPHPALSPKKYQSILLLLISSHNVNHLSPRTDPIFPTNHQKYLNWSDNSIPIYTDASNTAKPLACLEETFLCLPDGSHCVPTLAGQPGSAAWPPNTGPKTPEGEIALYFTSLVVASSNMYMSIRARLGSGLVASTMISQAMSLPLAEEQWKTETRRLFQTSVAGWYIVARDASRARWAGETGLQNYFARSPKKVVEKLCRLYKFHATGWKNVNVVGSVVVVCIWLLILLVGLEVERKVRVFVPLGRGIGRCSRRLYAWMLKCGPPLRQVYDKWKAGLRRLC